MIDDWAEEIRPGRMTRRRSLQILGLAGGGAVVASLGVSIRSLLPPPIACVGEVSNRFYFSQPDRDVRVWWNNLVNRPARITDFPLWFGAAMVWRAVLGEDGLPQPGCGFQALVIRVPGDGPAALQVSDEAENRFSFRSFIVDETLDAGRGPERFVFVAFYDKCVHLCCKPGWHLLAVPGGYRTGYTVRPRTFNVAPEEDPIFCNCHGSQYDPVTLTVDTHQNGVRYVGATRVHDPAPRALPAIPIRLIHQGNDYFLEGIFDPPDGHPEWYSAYCR